MKYQDISYETVHSGTTNCATRYTETTTSNDLYFFNTKYLTLYITQCLISDDLVLMR